MTDVKPRIVIYGAGQYGCYVARFAAEKGWPIVAAFNRSGPKVGKDLGEVAGAGRDLGVIIQDCDTANYDDIDADIAIVAQTNLLRLNMTAYRRLLGAGINVLCHGGESYYPWGNDQELAAEIDEIAKKNNVTFTGGGIWDMSRIWAGILVTGPCTELNSLFHSSITDIEGQAKDKAQAMLFGPGQTADEFAENSQRLLPNVMLYKTIPEHVMAALGYTVSDTKVSVEPVFAEAPLKSALLQETLDEGTIIGTRTIGEVETVEGATARCEIELRLFYPGDVEHMYWSVNGKPRSSIRSERADSAHATASCLFNRIPDVIAAPAGIVPVSKMGPLKPTVLI